MLQASLTREHELARFPLTPPSLSRHGGVWTERSSMSCKAHISSFFHHNCVIDPTMTTAVKRSFQRCVICMGVLAAVEVGWSPPHASFFSFRPGNLGEAVQRQAMEHVPEGLLPQISLSTSSMYHGRRGFPPSCKRNREEEVRERPPPPRGSSLLCKTPAAQRALGGECGCITFPWRSTIESHISV